MFDMFGMSKADTKDAIQEISKGVTIGLIDSFEFKLMDKQHEIDRLKEKITEEKTYKERYEELLLILEDMKKPKLKTKKSV